MTRTGHGEGHEDSTTADTTADTPTDTAAAAPGDTAGAHAPAAGGGDDTGSTAADPHPLLREAPSTVALLADERDFTAMRHHPPYAGIADHAAYLRVMEQLLRTLTAQGVHTTLALFDPARFEAYCADARLDPGSAGSRTRYTADVAAAGATVPYDGQPLEQLLPVLLDASDRRADLEHATLLLATAGDCATCGADIGHAAYARASEALMRLAEAAGPGEHHLVCTVPAGDVQLSAALHARSGDGEGDGMLLAEADALLFCSVLAAGIAGGSPGGVVVRTTGPKGHDRVRGWALRGAWLRPLTAAEVFTAYCTDPVTGEPVPPEPGLEHLPGIGLPEPDDHC